VRGEPVHGKTASILRDDEWVHRGLPQGFEATRYHSLVIEPGSVPACLVATSRTEDEVIVGGQHKQHHAEDVQFHPENVRELLMSFLGL
jgi:anthranilate synthase component II